MLFFLPPTFDSDSSFGKDVQGNTLPAGAAPNLSELGVINSRLLRWEECLVQEGLQNELQEGFSLWEFDRVCVVLGRGSKLNEVNLDLCSQDGIPVVRRCSGGATILAGPGCLMYSVILSLEKRPEIRAIDAAHRFVMQRIYEATKNVDSQVELKGICDLTIRNRKFSGNALRYKKDWLLYHGTLLYHFPLELISRYLATPPRQPDYREGRSHQDFLTNIKTDRQLLTQHLCDAWQVPNPFASDNYPSSDR